MKHKGWFQGLVISGLLGWVKHPAGISLALCWASHLCKPSFWDKISILRQWQGIFFYCSPRKMPFLMPKYSRQKGWWCFSLSFQSPFCMATFSTSKTCFFYFSPLVFLPPISHPIPPVTLWGAQPHPLSRGPQFWHGAEEVPKHRKAMQALPAPSLAAQWGHSGGHHVAQHQSRARDLPPPRHPHPRYCCLPNSTVRQKAADSVSQRAGGGELESSITKQALCMVPLLTQARVCPPPSIRRNSPSLPGNTKLGSLSHPSTQSADCQQPRASAAELRGAGGAAGNGMFSFSPSSRVACFLIQGWQGGVGQGLEADPLLSQ